MKNAVPLINDTALCCFRTWSGKFSFELVGKGVGGVGCGVECVGGNVLHMVENVSALFSYLVL